MARLEKALSNKVDASGYSQVLIRARVGRTLQLRIKTGIMVPAAFWNDKKKELQMQKRIMDAALIKEVKSLNEQLSTTEQRILRLIDIFGEKVTKEKIEDTLVLLKDYDGTVTEGVINNLIQQKTKKQEGLENQENQDAPKHIEKNIFKLAHIFLDSRKLSNGRTRHYKVVFRSMARFQLYCKHVMKTDFCWDIDKTCKDDVLKYVDFLSKEYLFRTKLSKYLNDERVNEIYEDGYDKKHKTPRLEERGENRIVEMQKAFKAFWNWMISNEYTTNNPLLAVKNGTEHYGIPYYLTLDERNQIMNIDLSDNHNLAVQRDIFIFQCVVGCRYADLESFTMDNIINDTLVYMPHKTKDKTSAFIVKVPLIDIALSLIKKYQNIKIGKKNSLFPTISNQKYNDAIKEILKVCKIKRKVLVRNSKTGENEMKPLCDVASSHMARRTFIGNIYKSVQDPNIIGRMSGHVEGSKAFARYRDIGDDLLRSAVDNLK